MGGHTEVEDAAQERDGLDAARRDLDGLGIGLEILDGEWLLGVRGGVLRARLLPAGRCVELPRTGEVGRRDGFHANSMAQPLRRG